MNTRKFKPERSPSALVDPADVTVDFEDREQLISFVSDLEEDHPLRIPALGFYDALVKGEYELLVRRGKGIVGGWRSALRNPVRAWFIVAGRHLEKQAASSILSEVKLRRIGLAAMKQLHEDVQRGRTADEVHEDLRDELQMGVQNFNGSHSPPTTYSPYICDQRWQAVHRDLQVLAQAAIEYAG